MANVFLFYNMEVNDLQCFWFSTSDTSLQRVCHFTGRSSFNVWLEMTSLKLQFVSFASLSPSLFENLELQLCAEGSCLCGLCSGMASARMNLMFWGECVAVSHCNGVDVWCTSQSQILACVLEYDPNHHKSRYQWWINLKFGLLISHQTVQSIIIVILYFQLFHVNNIRIAWLWV